MTSRNHRKRTPARRPRPWPGDGPVEVVDGAEKVAPNGEASPMLARVLREEGGSLLLLRGFLGVTFVVAGVQKLSNANFFKARSPGSFDEQLRGAILTSPLHHLLDPALHATTLVALLISFAELAVGLATLFGLLGRVAAVGGMVLSLLFFLTVSFNDSPYYYGADIVFVFAWTPLALAGPGAWSLDRLHRRRTTEARAAVEVAGARNSSIVRRRADELERRVVLQRFTTIGSMAGLAVVLGGASAALGRLFSTSGSASTVAGFAGGPSAKPVASTTPSTSQGSPPTSSTPSSVKGIKLGLASDVPVGGAATFTDPAQGVPAFVVQPTRGTFRAFSAVCTHAGCQVSFDQQNETFICPCHGSTFNASTGAVIQGPAPSALPSIKVTLGPGGELYVDG